MGKSDSVREARRAREIEEKRAREVKLGTQRVRGEFAQNYNKKYYQELEKSGRDRYGLELQPQFEAARRSLQAALMRAGLVDSSFGVQRGDLLDKRKIEADTQIEDKLMMAKQARQQDVIGAENAVLTQLQNTGDQGAAMASAAQQISANSAMPAWSPLGSVFTDFMGGLSTQAQAEREGNARYNVFGRIPGWSTGRYTTNVKG